MVLAPTGLRGRRGTWIPFCVYGASALVCSTPSPIVDMKGWKPGQEERPPPVFMQAAVMAVMQGGLAATTAQEEEAAPHAAADQQRQRAGFGHARRASG